MLERSRSTGADLTPPGATPTLDDLPRILAEFETIGEALDYAAKGARGLNFHDARGTLIRAYPYSELRDDALVQARRLIALGIKPGDRVALIAETGPEFAAAFFGAVYAGAWPVPLPLPTSFGGRDAYVEQLAVQLQELRPGAVPLSRRACRLLRRRGGKGRRHRPRLGIARRRRAGRTASFPRPRARTSPICNIPAARPASRTASRSPTTRCSTISTPMASGSKVLDTRPLHLVAALVS